jgi:hypothetical protein
MYDPSLASDASVVHTKGTLNPSRLPENFTSYAIESIGNNELCIVGAATDDDGLNQKPVVYVADSKKHPIWVARLDLPKDTYQSRATHCNRSGNSVYVLLQSDTQSEQTLSQTLLHAIKLDVAAGTVQAQQNVNVPGAYTAWVDEGASHFQWQGTALMVSGNYRLKSDQDQPATFTVRLNSALNP